MTEALARLGGGAVAVAFGQPVLVVVGGELADAGAELLERVEALDPEDLFLERLDELLDAAVGLGLVVQGWAARDAEVVDLGLVVIGAKARPAVVAQRQAGSDRLLDRAEALGGDLPEQVGGRPAVHAGCGVDPGLAGGVVDDRKHRAAPLLAGVALGGVGRPQRVGDLDGDLAVVQPARALAHVRRGRQQPGLAGQAQHALARGVDAPDRQPGADLAVALADERRLGDLAADRRQQLAVGHRADRPRPPARRSSSGLRGAASAALLARRRPGDPRDPADPGQRELQPSCDVQRLGRRGRRSISSCSARRMSRSIDSSPILRCASASRRSSSGRERDFRPSRPAAKNSSRQPLIVPAATRHSRANASNDSPRNRRRTTPSLRRALQRTSRPPSGRPSGAPERDPSLRSIPASMTPDIIDLHGSNQVSGWNRVRGSGYAGRRPCVPSGGLNSALPDVMNMSRPSIRRGISSFSPSISAVIYSAYGAAAAAVAVIASANSSAPPGICPPSSQGARITSTGSNTPSSSR